MALVKVYVDEPDIPIRDWQAELKRLVDFMKVDDRASSALWVVLSALRGPDSANGSVKVATTGVIRDAIGLELYGLTINPDSPALAKLREGHPELHPLSHFGQHCRSAFKVLDLPWEPEDEEEE